MFADAAIGLDISYGYRFRVYGNYWDSPQGMNILHNQKKYYGNYLPIPLTPSLYSSSKIILGVHCDNSSATQISLRPFEVLSSGGFHLSQWSPATTYWFKDGVHLVTARTTEEARDKMYFYINNDTARIKIANQGKEYVLKEHTYQRRVNDILLPNL